MKMKYCFSMLIAALLIIPNLTNAQLVTIGAGGGITQVLAPDYFINEVSEGGYGYSTELNFGLLGKIDLQMLPITPRAFVIYHLLSGSGESSPIFYGEPNVDITQSILEIGAGVQYNFIPAPLGFDPYLALDFAFPGSGREIPVSRTRPQAETG